MTHRVQIIVADKTFVSGEMSFAGARDLRASILGIAEAENFSPLLVQEVKPMIPTPTTSVTLEFHNICLERAAKQYNELARSTVSKQVNDAVKAERDEALALREKDFEAFVSSKRDLEKNYDLLQKSSVGVAEYNEACSERDKNYQLYQQASQELEALKSQKAIVEQTRMEAVEARDNLRNNHKYRDILINELLEGIQIKMNGGNTEVANKLLYALRKTIAG